jgi:hypothetical protein
MKQELCGAAAKPPFAEGCSGSKPAVQSIRQRAAKSGQWLVTNGFLLADVHRLH